MKHYKDVDELEKRLDKKAFPLKDGEIIDFNGISLIFHKLKKKERYKIEKELFFCQDHCFFYDQCFPIYVACNNMGYFQKLSEIEKLVLEGEKVKK